MTPKICVALHLVDMPKLGRCAVRVIGAPLQAAMVEAIAGRMLLIAQRMTPAYSQPLVILSWVVSLRLVALTMTLALKIFVTPEPASVRLWKTRNVLNVLCLRLAKPATLLAVSGCNAKKNSGIGILLCLETK